MPAHLDQTLPVLSVLIRLLATRFRVKRNALLIFENFVLIRYDFSRLVLKITHRVLNRYENSLLYLILQELSRKPF